MQLPLELKKNEKPGGSSHPRPFSDFEKTRKCMTDTTLEMSLGRRVRNKSALHPSLDDASSVAMRECVDGGIHRLCRHLLKSGVA